jgi:GT2 family glycosyltransferase
VNVRTAFDAAAASLAVGICTRNRPGALVECIRSLGQVAEVVREVIVLDDGSTPAVEAEVRAALGASVVPLRFLRNEQSRGPAAGRNQVARAAGTAWILYLDDDAFVVNPSAVLEGLAFAVADARVGVVAFAQGDRQGIAYDASIQPAPVEAPAWVSSFIGYAHLLRRSALLEVGGFREKIGINGEEKELCIRLLDRGYGVVYLPHAVIGHVADPGGRDPVKYLHQSVRNDVLGALYTLPFPLMGAMAVVRARRYFSLRRALGVADAGGFRTLLHDLAASAPDVWRGRSAVRWSTVRRWRALTRSPHTYEPPSPEDG